MTSRSGRRWMGGGRPGRAGGPGRDGNQARQPDGHDREAGRGERAAPRTNGVSKAHAGLTRGAGGWFTRAEPRRNFPS